MVLIGDDVVGGFFALNGGALAREELGGAFYLAPETVRWESLGFGYSGWLQWLLSGDLEEFYADYRWSGWRDEVGKLPGDRGYSIFPFPWAKGVAISRRSRAPVPLSEIWSLERRSQKSFDRSPSDGEDEPSPEPADPPPGR